MPSPHSVLPHFLLGSGLYCAQHTHVWHRWLLAALPIQMHQIYFTVAQGPAAGPWDKSDTNHARVHDLTLFIPMLYAVATTVT